MTLWLAISGRPCWTIASTNTLWHPRSATGPGSWARSPWPARWEANRRAVRGRRPPGRYQISSNENGSCDPARMTRLDVPGEDVVGFRAANPGPFTLSGTNSWIVGREPAWLVDPGPSLPAHVDAL